MKVIFFGTPDFVISLPKAIIKAGFNLLACVTASDRPVGRKRILTHSPVKAWAQENKIQVIDDGQIEAIAAKVIALKPDVGVLAAYGKIIPKSLIDIFPKGILVVHPSLLPKYRGASPVQAAIMAGDAEIGVSIIQMDEKIDHGPLVSQFKDPLPPDATPDKLYPKLFSEAAEVLITILPAYIEGQIKLREQDHSKATYCKILKKEDGFIPPQIIAPRQGHTLSCLVGPYKLKPTPENLERFIRAMHPWPGAYTKLKIKNERLKIVKFLPEGKIQIEGGKPMSLADFLNGYPEAKPWLTKIYPDLS